MPHNQIMVFCTWYPRINLFVIRSICSAVAICLHALHKTWEILSLCLPSFVSSFFHCLCVLHASREVSCDQNCTEHDHDVMYRVRDLFEDMTSNHLDINILILSASLHLPQPLHHLSSTIIPGYQLSVVQMRCIRMVSSCLTCWPQQHRDWHFHCLEGNNHQVPLLSNWFACSYRASATQVWVAVNFYGHVTLSAVS